MVVRTRLRRVLLPLALYCVSGGVGSFFVWHAINGDRGLKVSDEYEKSITHLQAEFDATHATRLEWAKRISLMRGEAIDQDILEEEARVTLGRVRPDEVVIFYAQR